jgi:hypothetical protein
MRRGMSEKPRNMSWCGARIYRLPLRWFLRGVGDAVDGVDGGAPEPNDENGSGNVVRAWFRVGKRP